MLISCDAGSLSVPAVSQSEGVVERLACARRDGDGRWRGGVRAGSPLSPLSMRVLWARLDRIAQAVRGTEALSACRRCAWGGAAASWVHVGRGRSRGVVL